MLKVLLAALLNLIPLSAFSAPAELALPGVAVRGESTFRYLGIPIYNARLFTVAGAPLNWGEDFALELTYLRQIRQQDLIDSTLQEFTRSGPELPLRAELSNCFASVTRGDRYLAVSDGPDKLSFWRNDTRTCSLIYPDIKARFMGIFLGENTRSRGFTQRLLGN